VYDKPILKERDLVMLITDKRRFFRINETIGLSYHKLTAAEKIAIEKDLVVDSALTQLVTRLNAQLGRVIDNVQTVQPDVAIALNLINQKVNFLFGQLGIESELIYHIAFEMREANLSASGVAFPSNEPYALEDLLRVDMLFEESNLQVSAVGKVVKCESMTSVTAGQPGYFVRLHFVQITPNDQETIAQHVVNKQNRFFAERKKNEKPH
jgi:hypothetical protein